MAARKRSARRPARPSRTTAKKKATRPARKSAPKATAPTDDVVYTDVRREMRARLLARFR